MLACTLGFSTMVVGPEQPFFQVRGLPGSIVCRRSWLYPLTGEPPGFLVRFKVPLEVFWFVIGVGVKNRSDALKANHVKFFSL